jgi:flagellar hook-associated protein 3 FlgL
MRVTQNTSYEAVREGVQRSKGRLEKLQMQASTLRKMNTPSDNPSGVQKVMEIRTDKVNNEQYQNNAKLAETFLANSDHALTDLAEVAVRAKEIALGQASGASSNQDTRLGVAEEVSQLFQRAVAVANTRIGDRYLFGGFKTDRMPIDQDGNYQGDQGQMMIEVAKDVFISMNVPGVEVFNTQPKSSQDGKKVYGPDLTTSNRAPAGAQGGASGEEAPPALENVNLFDELQNLRIGLLTGDMDGIRDTLERLDDIHSKLVSVRSKIGSRISGIQGTVQAMERHNLTASDLTSHLEDADMAKVMSDIAKEETVYRSVLGSSQKLLQPTLMDFIK